MWMPCRSASEILTRNADAEYLMMTCGLVGSTTDRAIFRAKVPAMVTYEDLQPYILRIAHGDRSPILFGSGHPVSEFLTSSGNSGGEHKLIPTVKDELDHRLLLSGGLVMPVIKQYMPGLDKGTCRPMDGCQGTYQPSKGRQGSYRLSSSRQDATSAIFV